MQRPARFQRAHLYPADRTDTLAEFVGLFDHHRYEYIYRPFGGNSWLSAKEQWKLTDSEILKAVGCKHPKYLLGFRFGRQTRFAVIDIDAGSEYHNLRSFQKLKTILANAGISKVVPFRSSDSDGWHLYIFFDELINSAHLRKSLVQLLAYTGFRIKSGTLEIFPNTSEHSAGMGLRLPLQPGFAFLHEKNPFEVQMERWELSPIKALDYFLDEVNTSSNSYKQFLTLQKHAQCLADKQTKLTELRARVAAKKEPGDNVIMLKKLPAASEGDFHLAVQAIFNPLPPGINTDVWYRGRNYHQEGLTGASQRADAILCLSHYFFYGDPSRDLPALGYGYETERELAIKQILELRHNGFSHDLTQGRQDAIAQIERAAHWIPPHKRSEEPKKYISQRPIAWVRENANRQVGARTRIQNSLEELKLQGRAFTTVELQKAAGCGRDTLYKHADIWRQDYEDLASGFFAICPDEYNGVEGAASSESKPLPLPDKKDIEPGRLAARRIVYELMMREERRVSQKEKHHRQVSDSLLEKWKRELETANEKAAASTSIKELNGLVPIYLSILYRAPDDEAEALVRTQLKEVRLKIQDATSKVLFSNQDSS